jgi:hypothetical protein
VTAVLGTVTTAAGSLLFFGTFDDWLACSTNAEAKGGVWLILSSPGAVAMALAAGFVRAVTQPAAATDPLDAPGYLVQAAVANAVLVCVLYIVIFRYVETPMHACMQCLFKALRN